MIASKSSSYHPTNTHVHINRHRVHLNALYPISYNANNHDSFRQWQLQHQSRIIYFTIPTYSPYHRWHRTLPHSLRKLLRHLILPVFRWGANVYSHRNRLNRLLYVLLNLVLWKFNFADVLFWISSSVGQFTIPTDAVCVIVWVWHRPITSSPPHSIGTRKMTGQQLEGEERRGEEFVWKVHVNLCWELNWIDRWPNRNGHRKIQSFNSAFNINNLSL